jgi:hypothetical protein
MAQHSAHLSVRKNLSVSGVAKGWVYLKESHLALAIG